MRPKATSVCGLKLRLYEALSYYCMRPSATTVCGLKLLAQRVGGGGGLQAHELTRVLLIRLVEYYIFIRLLKYCMSNASRGALSVLRGQLVLCRALEAWCLQRFGQSCIQRRQSKKI